MNFFQNKNCDICKAKALKFRYYKVGRNFYLCNKKICDLIAQYKAGWLDKDQLPDEIVRNL